MPQKANIIHLLPNAHLDPVWLWDWREGLNEAEATVETVLNLMDENDQLTFNRGEVQVYQHIERKRPDLFKRILKYVETKRWDVIGGTYIQPDENLSSTETICRQFEWGLKYFEESMGIRPTVAWQPDSFGHPRGWPDILKAFGMECFAFTRPLRAQFPMTEAAFRWKAQSGGHLLCYRPHWRSYCNNRDNIGNVLQDVFELGSQTPLTHKAAYIGLGNHGGGPTKRHLVEAIEWAKKNPEVEVRFSTHHAFFETLKHELKGLPEDTAPEVTEEFGYCLRGCYSSVQSFKQVYRKAEAAITAAEVDQAVLLPELNYNLDEAWRSVLFNSFHDILPGSSIERAVEEQTQEVGGTLHQARCAHYEALRDFAHRVNTMMPASTKWDAPRDTPFIIWNGTPYPYRGHIEMEASIDYRPLFHLENQLEKAPFVIRNTNGRIISHQAIETEHHCMPNIPWRKRAVVPVKLPPFGWKILRLGMSDTTWIPKFSEDAATALKGKNPRIQNHLWAIACTKEQGISIKYQGRSIWGRGKLGLLTVKDEFGSWGGMNEEPDSWQLDQVLSTWKLQQYEILETGPERAKLWTRWEGGRSWIDLTFTLHRKSEVVSIEGRLLWNERSARLQLVLPSRGQAVCDVTGGISIRGERGQMPVGRWFTRENTNGETIGIASDVLSDVDFLKNESRLTLARATRYGDDVPTKANEELWRPAVDCGELKFQIRLFTGKTNPDTVTRELLTPPTVMPVAATDGELAVEGSLGQIRPANVRVLAMRRETNGEIHIRVQNRGKRKAQVSLTLFDKEHALGEFNPQEIQNKVIQP